LYGALCESRSFDGRTSASQISYGRTSDSEEHFEHTKNKTSTIKLEKTDLSKKSFYVPTSWIKLKTCSQELTSIVSADMNVQSPVDIFFSKDIVWSVMREQEFCWQEINLKLPMEELRTPTDILNAGV
jgi:hypothetical protein